MTTKKSANLLACDMLDKNGFDAEKIIALLRDNGFRIVLKYRRQEIDRQKQT